MRTLHKTAARLLLGLFGASTMWLYVQFILIPYEKNQGPMRQSPRGNLSDLYPRWLGARELLLHHRDPYAVDLTREIQIGYYGRLLDPNRPGDPKDEQGFAYPIYVVLLLAPSVTLPFAVVHEIFFWLLALFTAATVPLWLRALRWRLRNSTVLVWILFSVGSFPAIQGLKLQQLTLLVALLISASMYGLAHRQFAVAGILLALSTIKPQLVFLVIFWLGIWICANWRERQRVAWGFCATMLVLIVTGEILLPGWIGEFRTALKEYYRYTGGGRSVLDVLLPPILSRITLALLVLTLLRFAWQNRRARQQDPAFQWTLCTTLGTTLLIIPMFAPYNQLLLLPALMMTMRAARLLWNKSRPSQFICLLTAISVLWPFLSAAGLVIALAFLPGSLVQRACGLPLWPFLAIPIAIYALLLVSKNILSPGGTNIRVL
jgi:Glycosyltransferase family 87